MKYRNLTPHAMSFYRESDVTPLGNTGSFVLKQPGTAPALTLPGETPCVRCTCSEQPAGEIDGIPVVRLEYGELENLPGPEEGVVLICSQKAAARARETGRTDVFCPARMVRDETGRIIGCTALSAM